MNISLVVPVYNEELAIQGFYRAVRNEPSLSAHRIEIVFINDGSSDSTADLAQAIALHDADVVLINFSRNFGKEPALFAGLEHASGDAVIPMDVDLQDPISVIPLLVEQWQKGADVVLAKRRNRDVDSYLRRHSASIFYHVLNRIAYTRIEENVGDFRLMDRKVVDVIRSLPEHQLFMKGVLSWAGFNTVVVEFERPGRVVLSSDAEDARRVERSMCGRPTTWSCRKTMSDNQGGALGAGNGHDSDTMKCASPEYSGATTSLTEK